MTAAIALIFGVIADSWGIGIAFIIISGILLILFSQKFLFKFSREFDNQRFK